MSLHKSTWTPKLRAFLFASTVCIAGSMLAAPAAADDIYDRCLEDSDGTNTAWSACGGDYLDRLDGQLNDTWQQVFPELTPEGRTLLRTEQRAWNAFKEGSCLYYGNGDYGREGQVLHFPICQGQIIEQRIEYLNQLGDFASPREE
ncbi:lysozyme inhibitor LprI family protein [Devosia naphthalenivorans]|uniref:lysozyme inhibitor LprI family protein n=1 Tax=Devosia naphthalenivorans TaxID=2082392 RepID=UPI001FE2B7A0|nr:lysozyme inhibitor LprI family protein [Devosia naphthalenivorans]